MTIDAAGAGSAHHPSDACVKVAWPDDFRRQLEFVRLMARGKQK